MFFLLMILQIVLGLLYGNLIEWVAHKYFLHHLGKNKHSIFSFHWHEHHKKARQSNFYDDDYDKKIWCWNSRGKEIVGLFIIWILHFWVFIFAPYFAIMITYCVLNYYFTHKWAHQNPNWAKHVLRWHWEHHQMKQQNVNFCVTKPWFDYLLGTRVCFRKEVDKNGITQHIPVKVGLLS